MPGDAIFIGMVIRGLSEEVTFKLRNEQSEETVGAKALR